MPETLTSVVAPSTIQIGATVIFALAILHTFSTKFFEHLAHTQPRHAGLWHLLGEVEVVFGFWAMILLVFLAWNTDVKTALGYLEAQSFREPAFIFVIMVIAASRPVLDVAGAGLLWSARLLPLPAPTSSTRSGRAVRCVTVAPRLACCSSMCRSAARSRPMRPLQC